MEDEPNKNELIAKVEPMPQNASVTPLEKAKKTAWLSLFEIIGLSKLGEHLHEERESVKKVPLIILLCIFVGIELRGCWDNGKLESAQNDLANSNGSKLEAERDRDKYQIEAQNAENSLAPWKELANSQFPGKPINEGLNALFKKVESLQNDFDLKMKAVDPLNQNIAVALAEISIKWKTDSSSTQKPAQGSIQAIGFGKGNIPILIAAFNGGVMMVSTNNGPGWASLSTSLPLASNSPSGFPIANLRNSQYIQLDFSPPNMVILAGHVKWTINSNTVLDFDIPAQTMTDSHVFIRDLKTGLQPLNSL